MQKTGRKHQDSKIIFLSDESLRDLWYIIEHTNICIIVLPKGEEIMENIPNLVNEIDHTSPESTQF